MTWMIEFAPVVSYELLGVFAGLGLLLTIALLWSRARGSLLRAGALALLLLALANPSLRQEDRDPLTNIAVVVVDKSASQRFAGREKSVEAIQAALADKLGATENLEIRWVNSPQGNERDRDGTLLFGDLTKVLTDIPPDRLSGIVFVTDGQVHDVPESPERLGLNVPVHTIIAGKPDEFDRRLEIVRAPRFGIVNGVQTAEVRVVDTPTARSNAPVELTIRFENGTEETRSVLPGKPVEIEIQFPHAGTNVVELEVEEATGELTTANNRAVIAAEGVRENLRVLLVSGEPHAGERTWRNLLKSDAAVDLVHFTILRPPEKQDGTPINQLSLIAFPTRELFSEKLEEFDLIIFDRYHRRGVLPLLYLDNVAQYVEGGGAVLVAAGQHYSTATSLYRTPLSHVLPAAPSGRLIETPYRPLVTKTGERHPVTRALTASSNAKAWGRWFRLIETEQPRGEVLMNGPEDKPLLVLDRPGEGRVAMLLSDHAWLWARGFEGGGPYTALLRRLAHWLMKEPDLEEEVLKAKGQDGSLVIERRSMKETVDPVQVTLPTGETRNIDLEEAGPGFWRSVMDVRDNGVYRLKSGELGALALVGEMNSRELASLNATLEHMEPILDATGGGAFWSGAKADDIKLPRIAMLRSGKLMHGQDWMGLKDRDAYVTRGVRLIPLFTGLLALAALLAALSVTWFREGR